MAEDFPRNDPSPIVHVVDDDEATRTAAARLLRIAGYEVHAHASAEAFLEDAGNSSPGCVVLDVRMPGLSGLALQDVLGRWTDPPTIVFASGCGRVDDAVRALQHGAVDFLSKPIDPDRLLDVVARALARDADARRNRRRTNDLRARYDRLTARERDVFLHLLSGQLNKQIAFDLGTAERTIKIHRARVLRKLNASSVADLVRIANDLGIEPVGVTH